MVPFEALHVSESRLTRHGIFRGQHATENQAQGEHHVGNVASVFRCLVEGDNHVGEGTREKQECPD